MTGFYLLDRPNPNGPHFYETRRNPILAIVGHITAGLEDLDGTNDHSAERTAAYAASTERQVSWHSGSDADSHLYLLPASYTAFQCQGYNSSTYGHEISKATVDWSTMPAEWVTDTLTEAADCLRPVVHEHQIPLRLATKAELDRAIATGGPPVGFLAHSDLDPERRRDPGANFPWARLFALIDNQEDDMTPAEVEAAAEKALRKVLDEGTGKGFVDWEATNEGMVEAIRKVFNETNTDAATTHAAMAAMQADVDEIKATLAAAGSGGAGYTGPSAEAIAVAVVDEQRRRLES